MNKENKGDNKKDKTINPEVLRLKEQEQIVVESVKFWEKEMEDLDAEIEKLQKLPQTDENNKKCIVLLQRLEALIAKGRHESEIVENLEKEVEELKIKMGAGESGAYNAMSFLAALGK